ncbi:alpha/beta fold hydrolase [Bacillus suaedaesalsae]|uniref:Carboxylesterase n=1 Tax=Bacillus suaedaesalsae TaxID=2810349 RepID=A0ABS2DNC4_9BACI|nr:carboxylesterase [Bacillus suaedaesalsae]
MKRVLPKPFFFEGGERAVLCLHGFTGNSADCRMLARYLEKQGYTCYGPQYRGHGVPPEELVKYGPDDWWQDVQDAYNFLKEKGYDKIAVVGLSLGGVFSLRLGYTVPIKGIVTMCAPMYIKSEDIMYQGVLEYAAEYKRQEGKAEDVINQEMEQFRQSPMKTLKALQALIADVRDNVDMIYAPTFVVQSRHDHMINTDSANIIYENIESVDKKIKWYEESGHIITFDKEKDQLHEDVYHFLESIDWS